MSRKKPDPVAELVEQFATHWLEDTDLGCEIRANMTIDEALDAVFELLNAGILKLAKDEHNQLVGFTIRPVPEPPTRTIFRPGKHPQ
jgi:hypothetical protein